MMYIRAIEDSRSLAGSARMALPTGPNNYRERSESFWRNTCRFARGDAIRDELEPGRFYMIVSGWVAEVADVNGKWRQIVSFQLPGDLIRRSSASCNRSFIALTCLEIGDVELLRGRDDVDWKQKLSQAESLIEELLFNHLMRMRLTAEERLLHLLLELHDRLESVGLVKGASYRLPVTQQMLGDALGFSLVHIHRTLQELRRRELLTVRRGLVTLHDRSRLAAMACYEPCSPKRPSSQLTEGRGELASSVHCGARASAVA